MRRQQLSPLAEDEGGFTLVEVLTASMIFVLVASTVLYGLTKAFATTRDSTNRTVAANLAAKEMDQVRATRDLAALSAASYDTVVNGVVYHVLRSADWISRDAKAGPCDGGTGRFVAYKRVNVSVTWDRMAPQTKPVTSDSVVAPGVGAYDPTLGNIAVKVLDRSAAPVSGATVSLAGAGPTQTQVSGNDGCAFFPQLAAGSYTVGVATAGLVDEQGNATPSQTASVSSGTTSAVQFTYDRKAALQLTVGTPGHPAPTSVPITVGNSALLPVGTRTVDGSGSSRLVDGLFPFTSGYTMWAGSCADADPEAKSSDGVTALYPNGSRGTAVAVSPGATTPASVALAPVRITVTDASGTRLPGVAVNAIHAADTACTAGSSLSLGATDAVGDVVVGLPFGTWQLVTNGGSASVSLSPTVTAETAVVVKP